MEVKLYGITEKGDEAKLYVLKNKNGVEAVVSDFGAARPSLCAG